jgi:sialate O-acetylesterase
MAAQAACPAVRLPYLFADHMVVQRDQPVHVWGSAAAGEAVNVSFRGTARKTTADELGRWRVYLPPGSAGGPFELRVNDVNLRDVMVGDVWIAAGQSNMEWPVRWSAEPRKQMDAATYPGIRLARTMHRVSDYPREDWVGQTWQPCSSASVEHFSAVGYHFGRELHERLGIPIGLVQSAWGGTPAEAWTSLRSLTSDASLVPIFNAWSARIEKHAIALERAQAAGKQAPELRRRPGGQWTPGGLFNAMIAPLTPYAIRGVIWYQGETNTASEMAQSYEVLFRTLILDWRRAWGQGDFPFLFVQLANYNADPESLWPVVREGQRRALALKNTGMAVTIDIGEPGDIHPKNKREVGRRLALAARAIAYGERVEHSGPLLRQVTREGESLRLWFDHARGLTGSLQGFEVAGEDRRFAAAEAHIEGETVLVSTPKVARPSRLRYAWADNPPAGLFNAAGLPASPFEWRE